jgi:hypothetical protein
MLFAMPNFGSGIGKDSDIRSGIGSGIKTGIRSDIGSGIDIFFDKFFPFELSATV